MSALLLYCIPSHKHTIASTHKPSVGYLSLETFVKHLLIFGLIMTRCANGVLGSFKLQGAPSWVVLMNLDWKGSCSVFIFVKRSDYINKEPTSDVY